MTLLVDATIILMIAYAAYAGSRRGLLLVAMESISLLLSTFIAVLAYRSVGPLLRFTGLTESRARIIGFMAVWILVEISFSLFVRLVALPRLRRYLGQNPIERVLASVVNAFKVVAIIVVAIIAFDNLPISATTKDSVDKAVIPKYVLSSTPRLAEAWSQGLGRDISESLSFFVITTDPESVQRIELNFTTTSGHVDEAAENAMLSMINHERTSRGLLPLKLNLGARTVARAYSARMLAEGYFSHIDNDGHTPFDRLRAGNVPFGAAGENLALAPTLLLAHNGLMNSPGHRANILSIHYRTVGIGIVDAGSNGLMITQDFTD
jgi:uncharacterized protein YkwD